MGDLPALRVGGRPARVSRDRILDDKPAWTRLLDGLPDLPGMRRSGTTEMNTQLGVIRYSRGRRDTDAYPEQRTAASFDEFAEAVLADRASAKGLTYICGPLAESSDGRHHRCRGGAQARRFLPFDLDGSTPESFAEVCMFMSGFRGLGYTTASHTREAPRARFILELSRPVTRSEGVRLGQAMQIRIEARAQVKLDSRVYLSEQMLYTPLHSAGEMRYDGDLVDVDLLLKDAPPIDEPQAPHLGIEHDSILKVLDALGMVVGAIHGKSGGWAIRCPWEDEHTGAGGKADTAYFEPHTNGYAGGAFNCLHSHCANRGISELRAWLGIEAGASEPASGEHQPGTGNARAESSEESCLRAVEIYVLFGDPPTQRARSQTDILIDIGLKVSKALFCGDDDRAYAVIRDRFEVWGIASRRFREWLRGCYFKLVGKGANANSVRDAVETISAKAQFSGERCAVFLRTAEFGGKFYIDLTDDDWRVVEIDRDGWRVLDRSPVMFTRRGAPASLPIPEEGGTIKDLWVFLNVNESDRPLIAGWLLMALSPRGPYPVLVLLGEEGTAKSTAARMLRSLCDPSLVPLRAPTKDERDFLVGAVGNWCVVIDNLSGLQPWLSDALCRLSTGGGFTARTLYTDCDETAVSIKRPVILNGIDTFVSRGDLASRSIVLQLEPIAESRCREESVLWPQFDTARPRMFGALLTALSAAIRNADSVALTRRPRMLDFAKWATAAEVELGFTPGEFLDAYVGNLHDNALATLESPVAQALIVFINERREWTGTATELLNGITPPLDGRPSVDTWPKTARGMVSALNRLAPALRRIGISVEHLMREPGKGTRRLRLVYKPPAQPSQPSHSSQASPGAGSERDGSKRCDDSTVTESGQPSQTVTKNPNEFNGRDSCDGCDGSAGILHACPHCAGEGCKWCGRAFEAKS